jgi:hypothetical protein
VTVSKVDDVHHVFSYLEKPSQGVAIFQNTCKNTRRTLEHSSSGMFSQSDFVPPRECTPALLLPPVMEYGFVITQLFPGEVPLAALRSSRLRRLQNA